MSGHLDETIARLTPFSYTKKEATLTWCEQREDLSPAFRDGACRPRLSETRPTSSTTAPAMCSMQLEDSEAPRIGTIVAGDHGELGLSRGCA